VFTIEVFEDIGRAFMIGLLDFYEINPVTRLPQSVYKNVQGVKNDLLARYPIFIPKKKEEIKPKPVSKFISKIASANPVPRLIRKVVKTGWNEQPMKPEPEVKRANTPTIEAGQLDIVNQEKNEQAIKMIKKTENEE
jgi:hypothetical protein